MGMETPIIIDQLPAKTNISPITIKGRGEPYTNVEIFVGPTGEVGDAEAMGIVGTDDVGRFMFGGMFLKEGENYIFAEQTNKRNQDISKLQAAWRRLGLNDRRTYLNTFANSLFDNMQLDNFYEDRSEEGTTAVTDLVQALVLVEEALPEITRYWYGPIIEQSGIHTIMLLADREVPENSELTFEILIDETDTQEIDPDGEYLELATPNTEKIQLRVTFKTNADQDTPELSNYALFYE